MGRTMRYLIAGLGSLLDITPRHSTKEAEMLRATQGAISARSDLGAIGRDFGMVGRDMRSAVARYKRERKTA